jgi:hypothetical protein
MHASKTLADRQLADELMDAYVDWREACGAVRLAYDCWADTATADALYAFAAYQSALDQEEWAAHRYRRLVGKL